MRRSLLTAVLAAAPAAHAADVVVFAAASLKDALDDVTAAWLNQTGKTVTVSYGGSATLAKQIEQAAPADIFFSADTAWMDDLAERNLIVPDSRRNLLGNEIVLVAPKDATATTTIAAGFDIAALLGADGRLAMADVDSVPAGKYGKAALTALGVWDKVADRTVEADNVRAALAFVTRGEAPAGVVYATDAAAEPGVKAIGTFPAASHPPIVYPAALTASSANPDARPFLKFLSSDRASAIFVAAGFTILAAGG